MKVVHKDYEHMHHCWRSGIYTATCSYLQDFADKYFTHNDFGLWFRVKYCDNRWHYMSHTEKCRMIEKYLRENQFKRSHLFPGMFK